MAGTCGIANAQGLGEGAESSPLHQRLRLGDFRHFRPRRETFKRGREDSVVHLAHLDPNLGVVGTFRSMM
jgi:hypothetical protein